jgi:hypothetical protein
MGEYFLEFADGFPTLMSGKKSFSSHVCWIQAKGRPHLIRRGSFEGLDSLLCVSPINRNVGTQSGQVMKPHDGIFWKLAPQIFHHCLRLPVVPRIGEGERGGVTRVATR